MKQISKTSILLASLLLLTIPAPLGEAVSTGSAELISSLEDGVWVNETLVINGSTTITAQDANWILYDVTDPYSDWDILRSGEYFSEVIPLEDNLWNWSITIDVQGLNCTCWLEVSQPLGLQKAFLNRIIFIGEGPHSPVLSPQHDATVIVDEPVLLSAHGILADSNNSDSKLFLTWCLAPHGACEGESYTSEVNTTWNGNLGVFTLDASELNLSDGIWEFTYYLQDLYLRISPSVKVVVYVDQTDPEAVLIAPLQALEGDSVIIDGSGSRDGVWGGSLQAMWYVTQPDGILRVAEQSETSGMVFTLLPSASGNYTVQVDIVDMVGRRSSAIVEIHVENVAPEIKLKMGDAELQNPNSWQLIAGEELTISSNILDAGDDNSTLSYSWYLDDEIISTTSEVTVSGLETGTHELRLVVTDDDGASDTHEMDIIVTAKSSDEKGELNHWALILILSIIGTVLLLIRRMSKPGTDAVVMPKWAAAGKDKVSQNGSFASDETQMWDETIAPTEGKD